MSYLINAKGEWEGNSLVWVFRYRNNREFHRISDTELQHWLFSNCVAYNRPYDGVIRTYHINAYMAHIL